MAYLANQDGVPDGTTYEQINARCRAISWPDKTEIMDGLNTKPGSSGIDDPSQLSLCKRFWNEYVYPEYEKKYFELFPADRARKGTPDPTDCLLDYNRKMTLALCEWLKQYGHFHFFKGRVVFIKYSPFGLSWGHMLVSGPPVSVYSHDQITHLLDELLQCCVERRPKEVSSSRCAMGLAFAAGLLAMMLFNWIAA
ncbi:MAG: hypothetical protein KDA32_00220 [Phycisphaerales bacterium]|nr:hypothetical protein [Phycisphaerales bacterium]